MPTGKIRSNIIPFIKDYNHISVKDLMSILKSLEDKKCLSKEGIRFRKAFCGLFIKEE